jgi:hypothetical protein
LFPSFDCATVGWWHAEHLIRGASATGSRALASTWVNASFSLSRDPRPQNSRESCGQRHAFELHVSELVLFEIAQRSYAAGKTGVRPRPSEPSDHSQSTRPRRSLRFVVQEEQQREERLVHERRKNRARVVEEMNVKLGPTITDDMKVAIKIADRVAMLYQGGSSNRGPEAFQQSTNPIVNSSSRAAQGPLTDD